MGNLEVELKRLIIDTFELEGLLPDDIVSEAPLFGSGLGLDSIDALELGLALKKTYHIQLDAQTSGLVEHFASVKNLANFVESQQETKNA
ncbi:MAG: phosphopantetheine-binding protein [Methylomonas sp.]|nr:phosphopantetheine-binding protein [Methylomonas sp.]